MTLKLRVDGNVYVLYEATSSTIQDTPTEPVLELLDPGYGGVLREYLRTPDTDSTLQLISAPPDAQKPWGINWPARIELESALQV